MAVDPKIILPKGATMVQEDEPKIVLPKGATLIDEKKKGTPTSLPTVVPSNTTQTDLPVISPEVEIPDAEKRYVDGKGNPVAPPVKEKGLLSFMKDTFVGEASKKLKLDIESGNKVDPNLVKIVRQFDPETYNEIAKAVLPVKDDKYLKSESAFNALVGNVNDKAEISSFLKTYKQDTGEDYTPENAAALSPSKRIKLGIAQKGDYELATKELVKNDLETNFPIKPLLPNPLNPLETVSEEDQQLQHDKIINDPQETSKYLLKRQQEEIAKVNKLSAYEDRFSTESMNLGDEMTDAALDNRAGMKKYQKQKNEKLKELYTLRGKVANLKSLAENAISSTEIQDYLKEKGIAGISTPQAQDALSSKEAREKIGFRIALKADATLSAQLADIEYSLQEQKNFEGYENGIPGKFVPIPNDEQSKFKSLSETGDEKIQAQLRLKGYHSILQNLFKAGDFNGANNLLSKKDEVAIENGKALSDELFARLSAARFKDNGNKATVGTPTADQLRKWAVQSGFSPVENAILEKYMIPDEMSRSVTSNLQTSGFIDNTLESLGGTFVQMKNMFRGNAARTREILNDNSERFSEVGEYAPYIQELATLSTKEKKGPLTIEEKERKDFLQSNTNLLNWWQQFKAGTGTLTGQVAGIAVSAKGLDKLFKLAALSNIAKGAEVVKGVQAGGEYEAAASGIANNISNSPTFLAKAADYINKQKSLYVSSIANSYDSYKKESLQLMPGPENELKRTLYATMMSTFEGVTETIFDDRKILNALGKEVKPVVGNIIRDMSMGVLDKAASVDKLSAIFRKRQFLPFIKSMAKNTHQEATEEFIMDITGDIGKAILLDQNYDFFKSVGGAFKTYSSMAINGGLVAGMAARGDVRNSTFNKSTLYNMASNPVEYTDEINRLLLNGQLSPQEQSQKLAIVNAASGIYSNMVVDGVVDRTGKNDAKNSVYLLHSLNENINRLNAKNTPDDIVKQEYIDKAERSKKIREGIYEGLINVDEFLNPVTPDEKVAKNLDIDFKPSSIDPLVLAIREQIPDLNVEGTDEKTLEYVIDKVAEAPSVMKKDLGEDLFAQVLEKTPTEKLQSQLDWLIENNPDSKDIKVLDDLIVEREGDIEPVEEAPMAAKSAEEVAPVEPEQPQSALDKLKAKKGKLKPAEPLGDNVSDAVSVNNDALKNVKNTKVALKEAIDNDPEAINHVASFMDEYPDDKPDLSDVEDRKTLFNQIAKEYHSALKSGENPDLVKAVEETLAPKGKAADVSVGEVVYNEAKGEKQIYSGIGNDLKPLPFEVKKDEDGKLSIVGNTKDGKNIVKNTLNISALLDTDKETKRSIDSGIDKIKKSEKFSYEPIIVIDGYVMDGFHRLQQLVKNGEETVDAYINTDKKSELPLPVGGEGKGNKAEEEKAIQKWLDDEYENIDGADIEEGHVSFDWDGKILEIFQGRNKPPLEFTREELIEKGVEFPKSKTEKEAEENHAAEVLKKQQDRITELQTAKDKEISEASKPEVATESGLSLSDLAFTSEANRQEHGELRQKLFALKSLINCLWL